MVTWGANQVFTFGGNTSSTGAGAPPTPAFGSSPAPGAGGSLFGAAPAGGGLFGSAPSPAPAAGGGGLFGSAPSSAPSVGGGLFGSTSAPAASAGGGLFGSASAPSGSGSFGNVTSGSLFGGTSSSAPTGGSLFGGSTPNSGGLFGSSAPAAPSLFGAPAPSSGGLFGSSAPSSGGLFGAPSSGGLFGNSTQPGSTPAIPAQAALQAHIDASARQEAAKLQSSLEDFHHAYFGTAHEKPSPFVTIVYNTMTSEQLQMQFSNQQAGGGYLLPPKPPQVSEQLWYEAVVRNPDVSSYIPVALIGAESLQARVGWQQQQASRTDQDMATLKHTQDAMQRRSVKLRQGVVQLEQMHATLRSRLLRLMNKVEVVRCMNLPLQVDEFNLVKRLQGILQQMDEVTRTIVKLQGCNVTSLPNDLELPDRDRLREVLLEHRSSIVLLTEAVQREKRDIRVVKERIANR